MGDLAEIWFAAEAGQRNQITTAGDEIDRRLTREITKASRTNKDDAVCSSQLGVNYVVSEDDKLVRVLNVWQFTKRSH